MSAEPREPAPSHPSGHPSGHPAGHLVRRAGRTESCMVDVGGKQSTVRHALARARVAFPPGVLQGILADGGPKGPIIEVARTAGILAAKRTADLIPLCHPLSLDHVDLTFVEQGDDVLEVRCLARCCGRTGVEMEALTGAAVGALTIYDMVKGIDKAVRLECVELLEKSGGRSGDWRRPGWQGSSTPQTGTPQTGSPQTGSPQTGSPQTGSPHPEDGAG